jgi:hypothetical protein
VILKGEKIWACGRCREAMGEAAIRDYKFEANVRLEPMSGAGGKRRYARKAEFVAAVQKMKKKELEYATKILAGKPVSVSTRFRLWMGDKRTTNTV